MPRNLLAALAWSFVAISLCFAPARAEVPMSVINNPLMQSFLKAPGVRAGMLAIRHGDARSAAADLRPAAARGNDLAQMLMAMLYFQGAGVPKNYNKTLLLAKAVLLKHRQPTFQMTLDLLDHIGRSLQHSSDPADQQMSMAAMLLPLSLLSGGARASAPSSGGGEFLLGHMLGEMEGGDE